MYREDLKRHTIQVQLYHQFSIITILMCCRKLLFNSDVVIPSRLKRKTVITIYVKGMQLQRFPFTLS